MLGQQRCYDSLQTSGTDRLSFSGLLQPWLPEKKGSQCTGAAMATYSLGQHSTL